MHFLALAHKTGVRLAETGFLLILFAGVWLAAAQVPKFRLGTARTIVAGVALAPHLVALVRAGAVFRDGVLAERPEQAAA